MDTEDSFAEANGTMAAAADLNVTEDDNFTLAGGGEALAPEARYVYTELL